MPIDPVSVGTSLAKAAVPRALRFLRGDALQEQFEATTAQVYREMTESCFAVCKALIAHLRNADPTDDDVSVFLEDAVRTPGFPFRMRRLFGEATKTASHRRRVFLVSVLYGLPYTRIPEEKRDRVDMLVERLDAEDVELLRLLDRSSKHPRPEIKLLKDGTILASAPVLPASSEMTDEDLDGAYPLDTPAFTNLQALGCATVAVTGASILVDETSMGIDRVNITPLGRLLLDALEQLRPVIENAQGKSSVDCGG